MSVKNKVWVRYLEKELARLIKSRYSALLLGPRQVGKTTLIQGCLKSVSNKMEYPLQNPSLRRKLESDPGLIIGEVKAVKKRPLVFVDEAQKVPEIFDAIQLLIDKRDANFIMTGSSARKLRRSGVNLLPGRIRQFRLDPLNWGELGLLKQGTIPELAMRNINEINYSLNDCLVFGSLPGIVNLPAIDRGKFLESYADIYLEEEIRAEALVRKVWPFSKFLELSAIESGTAPNFSKLSMQSGVSQPAIKEFYNILEDTLVVERVDPYLKNARKRILSSPRYYFFDLGVRNALAGFPLNLKLIQTQKGVLFEHAVILEIIRRTRILGKNYKICYWRAYSGAEVDCVLDLGNRVIPIEIKSSERVKLNEVRSLESFLKNYSKVATHGYVITMGERKEKLADNITALPWFYL